MRCGAKRLADDSAVRLASLVKERCAFDPGTVWIEMSSALASAVGPCARLKRLAEKEGFALLSGPTNDLNDVRERQFRNAVFVAEPVGLLQCVSELGIAEPGEEVAGDHGIDQRS